MSKYSLKSKLPHKENQQMIMDLCVAISSIHNTREAALLLSDLLGQQELEMIAKRLKIAELLLSDNTYQSIRKTLKVSDPTIARVHTWLQESGQGYRLTLSRTKSKIKSIKEANKPIKLSAIKRKYPMYFWPGILLEEWIKAATIKEKKQMQEVLEKLGDKRKMYRELDQLLSTPKEFDGDNY